jgi:hypothetical protein
VRPQTASPVCDRRGSAPGCGCPRRAGFVPIATTPVTQPHGSVRPRANTTATSNFCDGLPVKTITYPRQPQPTRNNASQKQGLARDLTEPKSAARYSRRLRIGHLRAGPARIDRRCRADCGLRGAPTRRVSAQLDQHGELCYGCRKLRTRRPTPLMRLRSASRQATTITPAPMSDAISGVSRNTNEAPIMARNRRT